MPFPAALCLSCSYHGAHHVSWPAVLLGLQRLGLPATSAPRHPSLLEEQAGSLQYSGLGFSAVGGLRLSLPVPKPLQSVQRLPLPAAAAAEVVLASAPVAVGCFGQGFTGCRVAGSGWSLSVACTVLQGFQPMVCRM